VGETVGGTGGGIGGETGAETVMETVEETGEDSGGDRQRDRRGPVPPLGGDKRGPDQRREGSLRPCDSICNLSQIKTCGNNENY